MTPLATIVGAGPVGCLAALGLAQRGYNVVIYEGRSRDTFMPPAEEGSNGQSGASSSSRGTSWARSINLAISERGLTALRAVDEELAQRVLDEAVPMKGRMIHTAPHIDNDGQVTKQRALEAYTADVHLDSQAYSIEGKCINSVSRTLLSQLLLEAAEGHERIELKWSHRLRSVTFDEANGKDSRTTKAKLSFDVPEEDKPVRVTADVVFGCDGHHSKLRAAMQESGALDVKESYIDPLYLELHIPAGKNEKTGEATYAIDPHHLHIWPRSNFMLIALPNRDKSFTATLFAPQQMINKHLKSTTSARSFFTRFFPDALQVAGAEDLVEQVLHAKSSPLGMVRCSAYHKDGAALLLGDAAHAMVPFYGQGLNCGLEDVRIMLEVLDKESGSSGTSAKSTHDNVRANAFARYSRERHDDLLAICQLAMDNYNEMSAKVIRPDYLLRKRLDGVLERVLPQRWWASLYTLVTFSNVGYAKARRQEARQALIVQTSVYSSLVAVAAGLGLGTMRAWSHFRASRA